ncbi:hypothetical protein K788_0007925 (plasmid) [Paraburkholderia caribensis MBA4]|uniref:Uncharacterized protein n=1 Tax=Paraburkholderia caribensis MBA4 TaxID=1323664 RepID=A0A0P0RL46_9BURK|nr:hypothetical protein K788_0007925 [Paraburkholderia caribensis MBA4]
MRDVYKCSHGSKYIHAKEKATKEEAPRTKGGQKIKAEK